MSKKWAILHLTDFHIDNPKGENELLREGFYQRYIDGFRRAFDANVDTKDIPIDAIVITGDFVNGGVQTANFAHAEKVIQYLCQVFNVEPKRVFTCNGNHDIDRSQEKKNEFLEARSLYNNFSSKFGNGVADYTKRFSLISSSNCIHVLTIDSTINAYGESRPGNLSTPEMDDICNAIKMQNIKNEDLLIVASHHPVHAFLSPFGPNPKPEDEAEWTAKHIWSSASRLFNWLNQNMHTPILWLSGDIHTQQQTQVGIIHAVVTGRFGTSTKSPQSLSRRHGRLIEISSNHTFKSWIGQSEPTSYVDDQENEQWILYPKNHPHTLTPKHETTSDVVHQTHEGKVCESESAKVTQPHRPTALSELLQAKIIETIKCEHLYLLGRYATSDCKATLAWVPMGDLMNSDDLFPHVVSAMSKHLNDSLAEAEKSNSIIIGVDSWGAILASQLSVITGIKNVCIAGRAGGSTHTSPERIGDAIQDKISKLEHVILVSDVIGTGSTLKRVHDDLCKKISTKQKQDIKWAVLSVICDEKQDRSETMGFASSNMTACKDLRMPILHRENLPDADILPTDISFMGQFPLSPSE